MSDTPEEINVDLSLATLEELTQEILKRFPDGLVMVGGIRTKKDKPLISYRKTPLMFNSTAIGMLEMYKQQLLAEFVSAPGVDNDGRPVQEDDDE